jgi:hypothetical protein
MCALPPPTKQPALSCSCSPGVGVSPAREDSGPLPGVGWLHSRSRAEASTSWRPSVSVTRLSLVFRLPRQMRGTAHVDSSTQRRRTLCQAGPLRSCATAKRGPSPAERQPLDESCRLLCRPTSRSRHKTSMNQYVTAAIWRREWDSNPRYAFTHTRFPSVRLKPLGHPSAGGMEVSSVIECGKPTGHPTGQNGGGGRRRA